MDKMDSLMSLHKVLPCEGFGTERADKWPLTHVHSDVAGQVVCSVVFSLASPTLIQSCFSRRHGVIRSWVGASRIK
jgi:hypothetical protein